MAAEAQFGPSALLTPANVLTAGRLLLTLPFLALVADDGASLVALAFWVALCLTDWMDGIVARRHGTTRSGAFLDPLADKVLVLGAAIALVVQGAVWWLPIALITVRELGIQVFRSVWVRRGLAVPATALAKAKTVVQQVAIGLYLLPVVVDHADWLAATVLWAAVALTLVSGAQYLSAGSRLATSGGSR